MKNIRLVLLLLATVILVAGCAGGPQYSALHSTEGPIPPGDGRIYVYRKAVLGAAVQPAVKVNDETVGNAVPQGYFFIDRPAGNYKISTTTEVTRSASLVLEPGQERYVRLNMAMGFFVGHVWPELIENEKAEKDIKDCHFTGKTGSLP
ncbi:MAG TPA: DUF2846 domain-containing protein [Verrucomicrobiae bacterium]|jgi:hypothetical protein|nr:DUF2846 domain-containing protein [Verrucomicrobiae bacterium]